MPLDGSPSALHPELRQVANHFQFRLELINLFFLIVAMCSVLIEKLPVCAARWQRKPLPPIPGIRRAANNFQFRLELIKFYFFQLL